MDAENTELFFHSIRDYPVLYAIGHADYKNTYKKEVAWRKLQEKTRIDGNVEIVNPLVGRGADVNKADKCGSALLNFAPQIGVFSPKQLVRYNLFGSNGLEGISSCEFPHFPGENKNDVIKNLNNQLKEAKDEIQLTEKINEELQQKLYLTEAELNRVRKESTVLINNIEDLKVNYENHILEKKKELNDIRDQLYEINKENVRKEITRPHSIPEVETRCIKDNDDQEPTWLFSEGENNQYDKTSEDKNLENIDFEIGVWNEADNESSDDHKSTRLYGKTENCLTSEDKNLENTDFPIEVWNGTDSESDDDDNISPCPDYDESFDYFGSEEDYEECEKELDKVISAALEQGIMFTFPYKSDISLIDCIADTFRKLYLSAGTTRIYEFLHKRKIFQVISEGASLNRSSDEEHEDFVNIICSDVGTLIKRSENLSKLKELALESIMNKSKQVDEHDFILEIDNGYFCIDYPQNSIIEVARILNNQKAKDLNLNFGILQVGNSIIRVENIG
ncbi:unnamed protein product [Parnassius apollo]|uniref:(apollo) hypothetical protein n=1 Tax=Parnassius apollo TaxID=110799 RepID=A0A8S3Y9A0_PARAO|nr:unnamed protein product [Parnassius apollo]